MFKLDTNMRYLVDLTIMVVGIAGIVMVAYWHQLDQLACLDEQVSNNGITCL